jgi:hypothetical protein
MGGFTARRPEIARPTPLGTLDPPASFNFLGQRKPSGAGRAGFSARDLHWCVRRLAGVLLYRPDRFTQWLAFPPPFYIDAEGSKGDFRHLGAQETG